MVSPCYTQDNKAVGSASCLDGLVASPFWHYYACVWERPSDRSNWLCRGEWKSSPRTGRTKYESIIIEGPGRHVNRQRNAGSAIGEGGRCVLHAMPQPPHPAKVGVIGVCHGTTGRFDARTRTLGQPFVLCFLVAAACCPSGKSFEFDPVEREFSLATMLAALFY